MSSDRYLSTDELHALGLAAVGRDVLVDRAAILVNPGQIRIGSGSRLDAFSIVTAGDGGVTIGSRVHLGAGCQIFGGGGPVTLDDFTCLSGRASLYTTCDDFTEGHLTNPTISPEYRRVQCGAVTMRRHALVGCGAVILPGVDLGRGVSIGALSLVKASIPDFEVWGGVPARRIGFRNAQRLLEFEARLLAAENA